MHKFTALAVLVGLASVVSALPSVAQVAKPGANYPAPSNEEECAYQLNYMPQVNRRQIDAIKRQPVYLIPVCEDGLIFRNDEYGWLFTSGNVGALRLPIARNRALMNALVALGYDEQDVISLRFGGGDSVVLYVHQRTLR